MSEASVNKISGLDDPNHVELPVNVFKDDAVEQFSDATDSNKKKFRINDDALRPRVGSVTVDSITALKALDTSKYSNNSAVNVLGYYAEGDGGGGLFYWDDDNVETDNGGTIIQPTAGGTGRWLRVISGPVNVEWFGVQSDGSDALIQIESALEFMDQSSQFRVIHLKVFGFYSLSGTLDLRGYSKEIIIEGSIGWKGRDEIGFEWTQTNETHCLVSNVPPELKNLTLRASESAMTGDGLIVNAQAFDTNERDLVASPAGATFPYWTNLYVSDFGGWGIRIGFSFIGAISGVKIRDCGKARESQGWDKGNVFINMANVFNSSGGFIAQNGYGHNFYFRNVNGTTLMLDCGNQTKVPTYNGTDSPLNSQNIFDGCKYNDIYMYIDATGDDDNMVVYGTSGTRSNRFRFQGRYPDYYFENPLNEIFVPSNGPKMPSSTPGAVVSDTSRQLVSNSSFQGGVTSDWILTSGLDNVNSGAVLDDGVSCGTSMEVHVPDGADVFDNDYNLKPDLINWGRKDFVPTSSDYSGQYFVLSFWARFIPESGKPWSDLRQLKSFSDSPVAVRAELWPRSEGGVINNEYILLTPQWRKYEFLYGPMGDSSDQLQLRFRHRNVSGSTFKWRITDVNLWAGVRSIKQPFRLTAGSLRNAQQLNPQGAYQPNNQGSTEVTVAQSITGRPANIVPGGIYNCYASAGGWNPLNKPEGTNYLVFAATQHLNSNFGYEWDEVVTDSGEYAFRLTGGGDPGIIEPEELFFRSGKLVKGTLGSLVEGEWAYGDPDSLGYQTIVVKGIPSENAPWNSGVQHFWGMAIRSVGAVGLQT